MDESHSGAVRPGVIQVVENGHQDLQDIARLQYVVHELFVVVAELPEEDQQLLVEGDALVAVRQVALRQRIVQQAGEAAQQKLKVVLAVDPTEVVDEEVQVQRRLLAADGQRRR